MMARPARDTRSRKSAATSRARSASPRAADTARLASTSAPQGRCVTRAAAAAHQARVLRQTDSTAWTAQKVVAIARTRCALMRNWHIGPGRTVFVLDRPWKDLGLPVASEGRNRRGVTLRLVPRRSGQELFLLCRLGHPRRRGRCGLRRVDGHGRASERKAQPAAPALKITEGNGEVGAARRWRASGRYAPARFA